MGLVSDRDGVYFIEIGGTRDPVYRMSECDEAHIHARIRPPKSNSEYDLIFTNPEEAYDFAHALLRAYDKAVGI
jgi:hypothetical protein